MAFFFWPERMREGCVKIALLTDAWTPQVSGVVTTLTTSVAELRRRGHDVAVVEPGLFRTVPCPTYPTVPLSVLPGRRLARILDAFAPDAVHVPTEGPIGLAGRNYCMRRGIPFTTAFTTKWPEYVNLRTKVPVSLGYAALRRFHRPARYTLVTTEGVRAELRRWGFERLTPWARGVDPELFRPQDKNWLDLPRPIHAYMGRVAVEKNLDAFLSLPLEGTKVVIGDGPALPALKRRYPDAVYTGYLFGAALARHIAAADVFVFPSRTDTFGIVLIEAMACGVPVAAYPVEGPRDVVAHGETGCLDEDLAAAIEGALRMDPERCRDEALKYPWSVSVDQLEAALQGRAAPCPEDLAVLENAPV
jgi:glycosyltransferase involved in cell wall biosynthesis